MVKEFTLYNFDPFNFIKMFYMALYMVSEHLEEKMYILYVVFHKLGQDN